MVFFAVALLFSFGFHFKANAHGDNYFTFTENKETISNYFENNDREYISFKNDQIHFSDDENITVSYYVNSENHITNFNYTVTGFEVISSGIDHNDTKHISFELCCDPNAENYSFLLEVELSSGKTLSANLYAITNEYGVFINPFSVNFCFNSDIL